MGNVLTIILAGVGGLVLGPLGFIAPLLLDGIFNGGDSLVGGLLGSVGNFLGIGGGDKSGGPSIFSQLWSTLTKSSEKSATEAPAAPGQTRRPEGSTQLPSAADAFDKASPYDKTKPHDFEADFRFWAGKGYTREQTAGILASMQHESGFDPAARPKPPSKEDAHGLCQWHKLRRENILKGTGINVSTAGYWQQMEACAWEMQHTPGMFDDKYFRTIKTADKAGAYFSENFERPADKVGASKKRAGAALALLRKPSTGSSPSADLAHATV
jgi:hypothetical protein